MPKPTFFEWDNNGTHRVPVTSGHKADGYIVNEIPGSGELNDQFATIAADLAWLGSPDMDRFPRFYLMTDAFGATTPQDPASVTVAATVGREIGGSTHTLAENKWTIGGTNQIVFPVPVVPGRVITGYHVNWDKLSNGSTTIDARLFKTSNAGTPTQIGSTQSSSANAPGATALGQTGIAETVAADYEYYLRAVPDTGTAGDKVYSACVIYGTPWAPQVLDGPCLKSQATGYGWCDLEIAQGSQLNSLTLAVKSGTVTIELYRVYDNVTDVVLIGAKTITTGGTWTDVAIPFGVASVDPGSVTVAAGAYTYTRSTGSYLTAGFAVGQAVTWTGFVNAGNNVAGVIIDTLSATVMTLRPIGGLVNETKASGLSVSSPDVIVGNDHALHVRIGGTGDGAEIKSLRY